MKESPNLEKAVELLETRLLDIDRIPYLLAVDQAYRENIYRLQSLSISLWL